MVPSWAHSEEVSINKERCVQHRSNHMIEVADKRLPSVEMGVDENGEEVVILKGAAKGAAIGGHGNRSENGTTERRAHRRARHGVVILHWASMVEGDL